MHVPRQNLKRYSTVPFYIKNHSNISISKVRKYTKFFQMKLLQIELFEFKEFK